MSWWDTSGFTSFATNVVKSAQKKIDKVLDIDADSKEASTAGASATRTRKSSSSKKTSENEGEFWNAWLGSEGKGEEKSADSQSSSPSSSLSKHSGDSKGVSSSWRSWGLEESRTESSEEERGKAKQSPRSKTSRPTRNRPRQKQDGEVKKLTVVDTFQDDAVSVPKVDLTVASASPVRDEMVEDTDKTDLLGKNTSDFGTLETEPCSDQTLITGLKDSSLTSSTTDKRVCIDGLTGVSSSGTVISLDSSETMASVEKHDGGMQGDVGDTRGDVGDMQGDVGDTVLSSSELKVDRTSLGSLSETDSVIENVVPGGHLVSACSESVFSEHTDSHQSKSSSETDRLQVGKSLTVDEKAADVDLFKTEPPAIQSPETEGFSISGERDWKDSDDTLQLSDIPDLLLDDSKTELDQTALIDKFPSPEPASEVDLDKDPILDLHSTSSLLTVQSQSMEKSGSVCSSMEFVTENEVVSIAESRDTVNVIPESEDMVRGETTLDTILEPTKGEDPTPSSVADISLESCASADSVTPTQQIDSSGLDSELSTKEDVDTAVNTLGEDFAGQSEAVSETLSGEPESEVNAVMAVQDSETTVYEDDNSLAARRDSETVAGEAGSDDNAMTVSSSSSVVKTMLEEAMEEKQEECDSHSHSSSDKSDFVKSEFSDKYVSGHESGDEIDTTTSSDIEIISTPTPNGDKDRPFDLSPLKIALSRAGRHSNQTHRRTDSQSSSSTNSKPEQMSPGRDQEFSDDAQEVSHAELTHFQGKSTAVRGTDTSQGASADKANNPYETEKLLKTPAGEEMPGVVDTSSIPMILESPSLEKLAEMTEVLTARENKLVQLSKENNDLLEGNSILRHQLKQSEDNHEAELADLNALTEEFTNRLGEAERKLQAVLREKESLKKQLEIAQSEVVKKGDISKFQKIIAEKEEQIEELMHEGEKLSKQQLQGNTIIKKLRVKEKETEQMVQSQKKKLENQTTELEHLKKVLDSKEDTEKKQSDAINQLNSAVQRQEKEYSKIKGELDDSQEKMRGLQAALDASYKEIAELHRANAAKDSQAQEVAVSAEMQAREELRFTMEREQQRYRQEKEALIMQIEDLRISLSRMEKEHGRREDMLRQEVSDLQQRLQEDEARNQELTQSVTSATRPLLRQIENLQSTYNAQSSSWETVEKNITDRLGEAQTQLAIAVEKERVASEKVLELQTQVTTLEAQNSRHRQEKSQLSAQLEMIKTKVEMLEDSRNNDLAQAEAVKQGAAQELNELKREKILLENQLEMERTKLETEKKKTVLLQDQLKDKERERPLSRNTPSPAQISREESFTSVSEPLTQLPAFTQEELLERSLMMMPHSPNGNKLSLYESLRHTGAANMLDSLISQLKQREGEITQLQSEIGDLERTRESMARELVNLSTDNDDLREKILNLPELEAKFKELEQRYNALLQMYGEKVEETEELKLDLQDVKELYKSQIDHLMKGH